MAKSAATISTGSAIASTTVRGGRTSAGTKGVIFARISPEGSVSIPISPSTDSRASDFSLFLKAFKGSDSEIPAPNFQYEPLRPRQLNGLFSQLDQLNQVARNKPAENLSTNNKSDLKAKVIDNSHGYIRFVQPDQVEVIPEPKTKTAKLEKSPEPWEVPVIEAKVVAAKSEPIKIEQILREVTRTPAIGFAPEPGALRFAEQLRIVNQQRRLAARVRAVADRPLAEVKQAEAAPRVESALQENVVGTIKSNVQGEDKDESSRKIVVSAKRNPAILNRREVDERRKRQFVGVDREKNDERSRELKRALTKLRLKETVVVGGESVVNTSLIRGRAMRSKILSQTGYDELPDGGIDGLVADLKLKTNITEADIDKSIEHNNALVRTSVRPAKLAELKELVKVYSSDEKIKVKPPVDIEEEAVIHFEKVSKVAIPAKLQEAQPQNITVTEALEVKEAESQEELPKVNSDFEGLSSRLFDIGVYSDLVQLALPVFERRKLLAE